MSLQKQHTSSETERRRLRPSTESSSPSSSSSTVLSSSSANDVLPRLLLNLDGLEGEGRVKGPTFNSMVTDSTWKLKDETTSKRDFEVDVETMTTLESRQGLNRFNEFSKLYPIRSTSSNSKGSPTCTGGLLESVSLLLWGVEAAAELLRRLLFVQFVEIGETKLFPRWILHQSGNRKPSISQNQEMEWTFLVNFIGSEATLSRPLRDPVQVFGLANILKRPIVVVVVCGQNSCVSGIYLPLLFDPDACNDHPLLLAYNDDEGTFLPLVEMASETDGGRRMRYFPLVDCNLESLSVRFLTEDEKSDSVSVVMRYINIREFFVETGRASSSRDIPFAALSNNEEKSINSHFSVVPMATAASKVQTEMSQDRRTAGVTTEAFRIRGDSNSSAHHPEECQKYDDEEEEEATGITGGWRLCAERSCKLNDTQRRFRSQAEDSASSGGHSTLQSQLTEHHQHLSASPSISAEGQRLRSSTVNGICFYPSCENAVCHFAYSVCDEHIDWLIVEERDCYSSDLCRLPQRQSKAEHSKAASCNGVKQTTSSDVEKEFLRRAKSHERTVVASASRCRSFRCQNFGNSQCHGLCHACWDRRTRT